MNSRDIDRFRHESRIWSVPLPKSKSKALICNLALHTRKYILIYESC